MSNKYKDFDEFFGSMEKKPMASLTLYGKEYYLPSEIPATVMLEMYSAYKEGKSTVSEEKQMEIAFSMLGMDNVVEWCNNGLTMSQLEQIILWAATEQKAGSTGGGKGNQ